MQPIENLLPHRAPMRFINALTHCEEKFATATAHFSENDFAVADGRVLETALVECLAQTVAAGLGFRQQSGHENDRAAAKGMLIGVSSFEILSRPSAEKTLQIEVREKRRLGPMLMIAGVISCDGKIVATGNLSLYA